MERQEDNCMWKRVLRPRVAVALLSPVFLLTDIAVITFFILKENWQGVIFGSGVLLVGTQAIYWYFRARAIIFTAQHQSLSSAGGVESAPDNPPSYEEVVKTEVPPPPYYMVVSETHYHYPSTSTNSSENKVKSQKTPTTSKKGGPETPVVTRTLGGVTSTFISHITSSEASGTTRSPTPQVLPDDAVEAIRAPITRELSRVLAPTHLSSPPTQTAPRRP